MLWSVDKREVSTKVGNRRVLRMFSQISNCRMHHDGWSEKRKKKKKNVPSVQESIEFLYGFKKIVTFS